ncbi:MAG: type IV secretion system DNA-binding domain-containing protein [Candidatus Cloacimonetes bacterium]|nr:type IV secretion system DNA-binding domain-containing protein [Candidatus Cloacimonadota bacterium]
MTGSDTNIGSKQSNNDRQTMNSRLLHGNSLSHNKPPQHVNDPLVILNGVYAGKETAFSLNEEALSKHTLLIGGTGCGKTTLFYHFVSQIKKKMTDDDVMIIFDTKGDFFAKFFDDSKDLVVGNSKQYASISQRWNIYNEILADGWEEKDFIVNAQEISKSFFAERMKNKENTFIPNAARDLLAAILISFIREAKRDQMLRNAHCFNNRLKDNLDSATIYFINTLLSGTPDAGAVMSYISGDSMHSQGVFAEMHSVMREILVGIFAEKGEFSLREFVRNKGNKTLFIEYDLSIGNMLTPIYRLMFDLALKEALGRNKKQGNVYLICDEFKLLPHLKHIDDGVNYGRGLGVKVFAGVQSIEQLYEIYGHSRGRNIVAGFSSIYAFKANDTATRDYITGLFGKNILIEEYLRADNKWIELNRNGQTVEDWDMLNLNVGEAIVGLPFSKPFKFYFNNYR